jgi:hypothetical protein
VSNPKRRGLFIFCIVHNSVLLFLILFLLKGPENQRRKGTRCVACRAGGTTVIDLFFTGLAVGGYGNVVVYLLLVFYGLFSI